MRWWRFAAALAFGVLLAGSPAVAAERLQGEALLQALREGGYVILFRHSGTEWSQADRSAAGGDWASCDPARMRQLSETGRRTAERVGAAFRALRIPVGSVASSPYCCCMDTARAFDFGEVEATEDLVNTLVAEQVGGREAIRQGAVARLSRIPPEGRNTVLVSHGFVFLLVGLNRPGEAGSVVLRPGGEGRFEVVAELAADDWVRLSEGG